MQIAKLIQTFNRYLFLLGTIPLAVITILTVIDVSGRYFRFPLMGTLEISTLCLALSVALTLAHTQAIKGNTDVDILFNLMPLKAQKVTSVFTTLLCVIMVGIMAWREWPWVAFSRRTQEWVDIVGWSLWPFKAVMLFGLFCLLLQLILDLVDALRELAGKPSLFQPSTEKKIEIE
jgi:TRAP-type C4-dicarboxylate transport system permease small subunit